MVSRQVAAGKDERETERRLTELDPVETERVQERRQALHDAQDGEREDKPHGEHDDEEQRRADAGVGGLGRERALERHAVQDLGQLGVRERQRPESQVRGRVGDAAWARGRRARQDGAQGAKEDEQADAPRQNSIVWMTWWMMISPTSKP